ncbi:FecR domain-containing protein [Candidatus Woesearchaeota archaeon]|nr:FecR domain-containing protein [Candidatus Woesearchaeota archaeon]
MYSTILLSKPEVGQVYPENGKIIINGKTVQQDTLLYENDEIQTSNTSTTIILYDSIIIRLQPNTKVKLTEITKQHLNIKQETGTTWTKLVHLTGIDTFSISTKNSIASVRGTMFELSDDHIVVGKGSVEYTTGGKTIIIKDFATIKKQDLQLIKRSLNQDEITRIKTQAQQTITLLEQHKKQKLLSELKEDLATLHSKEQTQTKQQKEIPTVQQPRQIPEIDEEFINHLKKHKRVVEQ